MLIGWTFRQMLRRTSAPRSRLMAGPQQPSAAPAWPHLEEEVMAALLIGYARVSTDQQDLTAQRNALAALGVSSA